MTYEPRMSGFQASLNYFSLVIVKSLNLLCALVLLIHAWIG